MANKIKVTPFKHSRRDCHSQTAMHVPDMTVSLRTILDRANAGLPMNARVAKHEPLPPDGDNMDDFDKGTEEILDLVDAQRVSERVKKHYDDLEKERQKKVEEEKQKSFEDAVNAEVARRLVAESQQQ